MSAVSNTRDVRVGSWNELQDQLFEESWQAPLGRFRSNYAFRGIGNAADDLRTSLMRLSGSFGELENHLVRNFRKYAQSEQPQLDSIWAWLALGQHHGLPTRLLDWTYSPFVAMHFATENFLQHTCDGAIWCVDYVRASRFLPKHLRDILEEEGSNVFTIEMLERGAPTLAALRELADAPYVLFMEPPSFDARIVNQYALFALMSDVTARLDTWLKEHPEVYRRIVIPAELKGEIRDKLDQANITERVLFPGLDGLSRWLRRHYGPPPGTAADVVPSEKQELTHVRTPRKPASVRRPRRLHRPRHRGQS